MKDEEKWLLNNEKQVLETELEKKTREHEEKMVKDQVYRQQHQGDILMQITDKDRQKRREL